MKIQFIKDKDWQVKYYLAMSSSLHQGFFSGIHAVILPYLHKDEWYYPDYGLNTDNQFIKLINKFSENTKYQQNRFYVHDQELFDITKKVFNEYSDEQIGEVQETEFQKFIPEIKKFIFSNFPRAEYLKNINIVPCAFGTGGSFGLIYKSSALKNYDLYISYRVDQPHKLIKSIISGVIQDETKLDEKHKELWYKRQVICDFFYNHTLLKNIKFGSDKFVKLSTIDFLNEEKGDLQLDSIKYFAKMGIKYKASLSYDEENIYHNLVPLHNLQFKEVELLKLLIDERLTIVSFDKVAEKLWKNEWREKFSLEGIAKVIEKLRKNLKKNNISREVILTVRKRGYLLFD